MKKHQQELAAKALALKRASDPSERPAPTVALDRGHTRVPPSFPSEDRDILLSREEAASYLRVSLPTMEVWSAKGEGPRVTRIGRAVRYRLSDIRQFVEAAGDAA